MFEILIIYYKYLVPFHFRLRIYTDMKEILLMESKEHLAY